MFEALFRRWKRHYLARGRLWSDRALFRSLNMAANAAQLPGGIDTTLYDLGRMTGLWVSAFEILAHPHTGTDPSYIEVWQHQSAIERALLKTRK
jgi:hypothetical protein